MNLSCILIISLLYILSCIFDYYLEQQWISGFKLSLLKGPSGIPVDTFPGVFLRKGRTWTFSAKKPNFSKSFQIKIHF